MSQSRPGQSGRHKWPGSDAPQEDSDAELTAALQLVLARDPFLQAGHLCVQAQDRVVTLEGVVPNETLRELAEFDAWYVWGVEQVINQLTVRDYL